MPAPGPVLGQSAPSVTAVAVTSDAGDDDTYGPNDVIRITVTFTEAVDVSGAPHLPIDMDPAEWGTKQAAYHSGSGSTTLVFTHTVVEPNISTQGIAVLADTLALNGGTLQSTAAQIDANLAHAGLGHEANHKVDWQLADSNLAPVLNTEAAGYAEFTGTGNAPRGILVSKGFYQVFSDPDGDALTYTASVSDYHSQLVDTLNIVLPDDPQLASKPREGVFPACSSFPTPTMIGTPSGRSCRSTPSR